MEGSLSESTQWNYQDKFSFSQAPPSALQRTLSWCLAWRDSGAPCGQRRDHAAPDPGPRGSGRLRGRLVRRERASRARYHCPFRGSQRPTPPPSSLDVRFKDPVAWCSLERGLLAAGRRPGRVPGVGCEPGRVPGQHSCPGPLAGWVWPGEVWEGPPRREVHELPLVPASRVRVRPGSGVSWPSACRGTLGAQEGSPLAYSGPQSSGGGIARPRTEALCCVLL